jgi:hypothetical protein
MYRMERPSFICFLFIGKPSADKRESAIWRPHDPTGHAFVEGNVGLWLYVVNAEKTAVVVKQVLRKMAGAGSENCRRMERV